MSAPSYFSERWVPMVTQRAGSPWRGTFLVSKRSPFMLCWRGAGPTHVIFPGLSPGVLRGRLPQVAGVELPGSSS